MIDAKRTTTVSATICKNHLRGVECERSRSRYIVGGEPSNGSCRKARGYIKGRQRRVMFQRVDLDMLGSPMIRRDGGITDKTSRSKYKVMIKGSTYDPNTPDIGWTSNEERPCD